MSYTDPSGLQKYHGDLGNLCDTDDCKLLLQDILTLELSLHSRDYLERNALGGGRMDDNHEKRIRDEDAKLRECYTRYFAKCKGDCPPAPARQPNIKTDEERRLEEKARYHRRIAVGAGAAGHSPWVRSSGRPPSGYAG